ncbi:hypothetical protein [Rhodococcus sp. BP-285]|uniref:hypothetical protein n=1 Tax=Rhodococcus sp. BP-285 TaxID=2739443 RepID=UPI001C9B0EC0|nr:hypothetical protein [Rhodococcus sp. BP-285]MBY6704918.1 hypothetical protein [Rhodococcus sp. BP-283]
MSILAVTVALGRSQVGGPTAVGQFSVLLAFVAIAQSAAVGGISGAALHKLVTASPSQWLPVVRVISAARVMLLPLCFTSAFMLYVLLVFDGSLTRLALICFFVGYAVGTYDVGELIFTSVGRYSTLATRRSLVVLVLAVPKIAFALWGNLDAVLILQGLEMCLSSLVMLLSRFVPVMSLTPNLEALHGGFNELVRVRLLWISSIVAVLGMRVDVLLVAALLGNDAAGQYSTASRLVEAASIVAASVGTLALRDLSANSLKAKTYGDAIRRNAKLTSVVGVVAALTSAALSPFLIMALYGPEFRIASQLSIVYSATLIIIFYRQLVSKLMVIESAFRLSFMSNALSVLISICAALVLVPKLGLWGAVIATLLAYYGSVVVGLGATRQGRFMLSASLLSVVSRNASDRAAEKLVESRS